MLIQNKSRKALNICLSYRQTAETRTSSEIFNINRNNNFFLATFGGTSLGILLFSSPKSSFQNLVCFIGFPANPTRAWSRDLEHISTDKPAQEYEIHTVEKLDEYLCKVPVVSVTIDTFV